LEACEESEAYYSLRRLKNPKRHVRPDEQLSVLAADARTIGSSWWAVPKSLVTPRTIKQKRSKRGA
jgi:hypothetical protein